MKTTTSIRETALRLLARRDHAFNELRTKLAQRGYPSAEIQTILKQLQQENLLNESRYIVNFIRSRLYKGFGPLKICAELGRHGIDQHRVSQHEEWQSIDWYENALLVRKKRFGSALPTTIKERLRQIRFLLQRGFTQEQVRAALGEI